MKKAIGAFLTGLLLSGAAAALYTTFRRQKVARSPQDEEQAITPRAPRQGRPKRERKPRLGGGLIDLNACTLRDLAGLEGLDRESAQRVIDNRPYRNKLDLVSRMAIPEPTYVLFSQFVTASDPNEPVKIA
jgi:hypothetical protein